MAAAAELTPIEYISHHLSFFATPVGPGGFWTLHLDTLAVSLAVGVLGIGFLWWVVRGASAGVPNRRQAFVELAFEFVTGQAKTVFHHGDLHRFVAPTALTVFVWVLLMNAMDFLPVDWVALGTHHLSEHGFRIVPTADVNTTFALALTVWALMIYFNVAVKGLGGWLHELACAPFGIRPWWAAPFLVVFNLLFNFIEYVSKPLSHSLRLFGNMYAGEIIFLLLWIWAAHATFTGGFFSALGGVVSLVASIALGLGWAIFHILIVVLQAFIFMMLTVVYIALAHEHH
ncbi:MAG: F0F1 ATP synthase subunit A [Burkholderiales bacterium]|nr:F0F1 ATP synthase subunit A [Burkholderiales bacterium]